MLIYILHSGDGAPRYVGKTTGTAAYRLSRHRSGARSGMRIPLYDWMRSIGVKNVYVQTVCYANTADDLCKAEVWLIEQLRADGARLLNATDGGDGWSVGKRHTNETRAKISASKTGKKFTDEHRAAISAAAKERWTPEERERQAATRRGKPMSDETKAKLSAAKKGKTHENHHRWTDEERAAISARQLGKKRGPYRKLTSLHRDGL